MSREQVCGSPIEVLSLTRGSVAQEPVAILTVRLHPASSFEPTNLLLSFAQAVRLRDALSRCFPIADEE